MQYKHIPRYVHADLSYVAGQVVEGGRQSLQKQVAAPKQVVAPGRKHKRLEELAEGVWERIGFPVDRWAVAAALESIGWRDLDAQQKFGYEDTFALADDVYLVCKEVYEEEAKRTRPRTVGVLWHLRLWNTLRSYGRGLLFVVPVAGQIVAIVVLGYSLWAWMDFTEAQATVVALGTLLSFIITGGFIQCIGREGHRYLSEDNAALARRACLRWVRLGMVVVLAVAFALLALDILFPFYPLRLMLISQMYFVLLSTLWLTLSILYVLEHHLAIILFTLAGIAPVYGVMENTDWSIYAAHGLGLLCSIGLCAAYGGFWMHRRARKTEGKEVEADLPPLAVQFHDNLPYFMYGVLYFAFLFVDRIIAWSVATDEPPPYIIWFRTSYELGVDWALLSMLLTLAVLQHTMQRFSVWSAPKQRAPASPLRAAVQQFRTFYYRQLAILLVIGGISILGAYVGTLQLGQSGFVPVISDVVNDAATRTVYWWAALSYLAAAVGLHSVLFFFVLGQPRLALRSLGPALAVNIVVGFIASRWFSYEYAVIGLMAGSLVFAVLSIRYARRIMQRFDYYYYSAY